MVLKTLLKTKFLKVYENEGWTYASRKDIPYVNGNRKPDAVCIFGMTDDAHLIVIKQYRKSIGDYLYECPAGLVDEGETVEEAAIREMKEETGLDITKIRNVIYNTFPSIGLSDETQAIVLCDVSGVISTAGNEAGEDIEVLALDAQGVLNLYQDAEKVDGRLAGMFLTIILMNMLAGKESM
jgi:ADP-ribose pyrophosphatase